MLTLHQKIFALIIGIGVLFFVLDLIRRRKLKEEYSWLWILVTVIMVVLVTWPALLLFLGHLIGSETPQTTIFLLGFIFVLFINIDYSIQISKYKDQIKKLAQRVGILSKQLKDSRNEKK